MTNIGSTKLPRFIIYCSQDPFYHIENSLLLVNTLAGGFDESRIDKNDQLMNTNPDDKIQVISTTNGGHFSYAKYNDVVSKSILKMIE